MQTFKAAGLRLRFRNGLVRVSTAMIRRSLKGTLDREVKGRLWSMLQVRQRTAMWRRHRHV